MPRAGSEQILDGIIARKLSGGHISPEEDLYYRQAMTQGTDQLSPEEVMIRQRRIQAKMPTPIESAQLQEQGLRNQILQKQLNAPPEVPAAVVTADLAERKKIAEQAKSAEGVLDLTDKLRVILNQTPTILRGPIAGRVAPYVSSEAQKAEALTNKLMLELKTLYNMGSNGFTDKDREILTSTVPNLRQYPDAAEGIIQDFQNIALKGINNSRAAAGLPPISAAILDPETGKPVSNEEIAKAAKIHNKSEDQVRSELRNLFATLQSKAPKQQPLSPLENTQNPAPLSLNNQAPNLMTDMGFKASNINALGAEDLSARKSAAQQFLANNGEINNANLPSYLAAVGRAPAPIVPQGSLGPLMGNQLQQQYTQQIPQNMAPNPQNTDPNGALAALYLQQIQDQQMALNQPSMSLGPNGAEIPANSAMGQLVLQKLLAERNRNNPSMTGLGNGGR